MNFFWVSEYSFFTVHYEGVRFHAIPKLAGYLQKFLSPTITLAVFHHHVKAPVRRLTLVSRGYSIPSDPSPSNMIQGVESSRTMEGMVVGRRHGESIPNAFSNTC